MVQPAQAPQLAQVPLGIDVIFDLVKLLDGNRFILLDIIGLDDDTIGATSNDLYGLVLWLDLETA
jgi:hypothetical protein